MWKKLPVFVSNCLWLLLLFVIITSQAGIIEYGKANQILIPIGFLLTSLSILWLKMNYKLKYSLLLPDISNLNTSENKNQRLITRSSASILLFTLAAIVFLFRLKSYGEAYERDLMVYMTIADRLLDGWPLYSELWDHKPPAIHWTYALFAALFSPSPLAIFMLGYIAFLITLLGCYEVGKTLGGRTSGIIAASLWSLISGDAFLQANQPNVEVFINAAWVWGVALILKQESGLSLLRFSAIGFIFFLATLYKTVAVTVPVLVLVTYLIYSLRDNLIINSKSFRPRYTVFNFMTAGVVAAGSWGLIFLYFFKSGDFIPFKEAVFDYNQKYAGNILSNFLRSFSLKTHPVYLLTYFWLALLTIAFLVYTAIKTKHQKAWVIIAYLVGSWIAVALPGRYYPHYYQLMLPSLAIGTGWFAATILSGPYAIKLKQPLTPVILLPLVAFIYQLSIPVNNLPIAKYNEHGEESLETKDMAKWINNRFDKSAVVYHWGAEPGVYFWSNRGAPIGHVYNYPLRVGPKDLKDKYAASVVEQLKRHLPDLVVINKNDFLTIDNPVEELLEQKYKAIIGPPNIKHFIFLVPK